MIRLIDGWMDGVQFASQSPSVTNGVQFVIEWFHMTDNPTVRPIRGSLYTELLACSKSRLEIQFKCLSPRAATSMTVRFASETVV